jgi:hypothetical protein
MQNFIATQTYALRSSPAATRFGFAWVPRNTSNPALPTLRNTVAQSIQGSQTDPAGACGAALALCDSSLAGAAFTEAWKTFTDATPPITTDDAPAGWSRTDVAVHLTAADDDSGVAATYYQVDGGSNQTGTVATIPAPSDHSNDGTHTITYQSVDRGGNAEQVHQAAVRIDTTAPVTTDDAPDGWSAADVTVHLSPADGPSGVAATYYEVDGGSTQTGTVVTIPASSNHLNDGAHTITYYSVDQAGNAEQTHQATVRIDTTPPTVAVDGPTSAAIYIVGSEPVAACSTDDAASGVATAASISFAGVNADGTGVITATCAGATDAAGNTAQPLSVTYNVRYALTGGGFSGTVNIAPTLNTGHAGRTYQFAFQLTRSDGTVMSDTSVVSRLSYTMVDCGAFDGDPTDGLDADSAGNSQLRFDSASRRFLYNWKTPSARGCYLFFVSLRDGNVLQADFQLT